MKISIEQLILALSTFACSSAKLSGYLLELQGSSGERVNINKLSDLLTAESFGKLRQLIKDSADQKIIDFCKRKNILPIFFYHADYPSALLEIPDFPPVIYLKGNAKLLSSKNLVSVVGSRRPTQYGISQTKKFVHEICRRGGEIVSGLAFGIDSVAHRACLESGGKTIAVLGTAIDEVYPRTNSSLAQEILSAGGAIISEYPPGRPGSKYNFALRNRIIAGLSDSTLVMEASSNSGSLITSDLAAQYGRNVYALPGNVDSLLSRGTNALIKEGAFALCDLSDVDLILKEVKKVYGEGDRLGELICETLASCPMALDEICEKTDEFEASEIAIKLSQMELDGVVSIDIIGKYILSRKN